MKPSSVRSPTSTSIWVCRLIEGNEFTTGFANLGFGHVLGEYFLTQGSNLVPVGLRAPRQRHELDALLGSGRARLTTVDHVSGDGSAALVTVRVFNGDVVEIGPVDIGIDDHLLKRVREVLRVRRMSVEEVARLLGELCGMKLGPTDDEFYFLLTAGAAAARGFEEDDPAGVEATPTSDPESPLSERQAFCIHGDNIRIAVVKKQVSADEEKYLGVRLMSLLGARPDAAVRLARGRLTFSDFTKAGQVRALAAGAMSRLMEGGNAYLKKWDEYGAVEGEMLLARARKVGALRWTSVEQLPRGGSGVKFFFAETLPDGIHVGDDLELVEKAPVYLERPEMTWAQYGALLEIEREEKRKDSGSRGRSRSSVGSRDDANNGTSARVTDVTGSSLVLDLQIAPGKEGLFLVFSMSGERAQIERRAEARRLILEGRSANPMLGLIIEEHGVPPEQLRPSKIKPLTAFVRKKVFAHAPTPKQEEAIEIALNTPDIALIQGPPGTGKTTVIAAIIERLNELSDKGRAIQGEVLISAFQHDAIENMMARLTVNSVPVPKFGRRSGESEIDDRNAEQIRRWSAGIAARLREKNPDLQESEKLREAQRRCHEYVLAPSLNNALGTIEAFLQLPGEYLSEMLMAKAAEIGQRLEHEREGRLVQEDDEVLRALWGLRTSAEGFLDDGPVMAQGVLDFSDEMVPPDERAVLQRAASWRSTEVPPFLAELRRVKGQLLEWYRPRVAFRLDKPRKDVLEFVAEAERHLAGRASGTNKTNSILAEFLHELESNPSAAKRAAEDYGFVFAATCQQSQRTEIAKRKLQSAPGSDASEYDTVIIDEAARSSPRDLLIPMSKARRRIILVGDHRQLPHLIDEEIARSLEEQSDQGFERAAIQEDSHIRLSMFQYLLGRLERLGARDGIKRWVTLDQQFRMHPLLGNFVSDHFYRCHSSAEAFGSPLPAKHFVHGLPGIEAVPAVWINVPARLGEESRASTSWRRAPEARVIADWIARWIDSPQGRKLTYGVISFYKAQVTEVFKALSARGYTSRGPDENWRIAEQYTLRPAEEGLPQEERLRIGTVDSFQGMEFDVVFLSVVRSKAQWPAAPTDPNAVAALERRLYGHLTSPNRLCVSMSRQKRLLVVVGDRALVEHELARTAIPGLVGFFDLCRTQGAVVEPGNA